MEITLPVLNKEELQAKSNEFAMKGAIETIKEFYTGYNSPYRKAIEDGLKNKGVDHMFDLPDIIAVLNEQISKEVDLIANNAISKTFIPMVKQFLTRAEAEVNFSDILKEFIECSGFKSDNDLDSDDYSVSDYKNDGSFVHLNVTDGKNTYQLDFFIKSQKNDLDKYYETYTLPRKKEDYGSRTSQTMKVSVDGVTLEMPFTPRVLDDKFVSYIAKMVIANTKIRFDVQDFDSSMFPAHECHC